MFSLDDEAAYELSHHWFLIDGKDKLEMHGVSIGLVLQLYVFEYFFRGANKTRDRRGLKGWLKKRHLEWHARFLHSFFKRGRSKEQSSDVLVFYDVNNSPMVQSLNLVATALSECNIKSLGVAVDRDLSSLVYGPMDTIQWTEFYNISNEIALSRISRGVLRSWEGNLVSYRENLIRFGLTQKEISKFLKFVKRQIRQICREIVSLKNLLKRTEASVALLASDAHRIGRIVVQLVKPLGIPSYVIQHGAPIWKYGYVPIFADEMLVWGRDSRDWFVGHGVSPEKLRIVGNPRFDNIIQCGPMEGVSANPKIFLLPNPIDRELTKQMISSFVSAIDTWPGRIIIKLHPSENDVEWFRRQIPGNCHKHVEIVCKPLSGMEICIGDVVVVGNSTAGIDAVLLGAAIVNVELPNMPNPIPYEKYGVGVRAQLGDLVGPINKILDMSSESWRECREIFLENILYRVDGLAARRAASVVLKNIHKGL